MNQLSIVTQYSHQHILSALNLNDIWTKVGIKAQISLLGHGKGKMISLEDEMEESLNSLIERMVKNGESDIYLLPASELPYPMSDSVDTYAILKSDAQFTKDSHPLANYIAIVGRKDNVTLKERFKSVDISKKWGKVVLAGFGPGDHNLITKKAEYHLHRAEVIFYDDLVNDEYLRRFCAKKVYVGKRKGKHKFDQEKINELMYQAALNGKWAVRIKGGDPLIFGRGAEEYHYLKSRLIEAEIIPGISSAFASAATAIIPFTERSLASSVVLLSGHDLHKLKIPKADTLVFYMGASNQKELAQRIIAEGWEEDTPVGVVHNVSNPDQKIYRGTLEDLISKGSGLPSPSIIIVGKTAGEYTASSEKWLYTGASLDEVKSTGQYVHTPLITVEPISVSPSILTALSNLDFYQRIVFTSRYAVAHFFDHLYKQGKDARALFGLQIDSIGKTTSKALKEKGIIASPFSEKESVEGMLQEYGKQRIVTDNILVPCSNQSTRTLQKGLRILGNRVSEIEIYTVVKNKAIIKQNLERFKGVVFSSPATVESFFEVYEELPSHLKVKCKGMQTQRRLLELEKANEVNRQNAV